jgi:hypothetical protein
MGLRSCVKPDGAFLAQPEHSINLRMCATHLRQRSPRSTMPIMCATLLVTELSPTFDRTLREHGKHARASTTYPYSPTKKLFSFTFTMEA